jgi:uncharacterized small protein (DUF1192 family)
MDAKELKASFEQVPAEDYKLTAVYLDDALALIVTLETSIAELYSRIAYLESALERHYDSHSSEYRRLVNLECNVFGYVQS